MAKYPKLSKKELAEIKLQCKMQEAALEFDEYLEKFRKKHKLSLRESYLLVSGSAQLFLSELLERMK
jgi:hypothetical protein